MARLTTRDYKRSSRSSGTSKLREFGVGVLVGALLTSAAFLIAGAHASHRAARSAPAHARHGPAAGQSSANRPEAASGPGASPSPQSAAARAVTQAPQYDFYRMLPRLKVPLPHHDDYPSLVAPPAAGPPAHAAGSGPSYLVQVGSYHSSAEADQVRARLARKGIAARVERVVEGSKTWNRVRIGPVSDAELTRVRAQLRTANMHALVIRIER